MARADRRYTDGLMARLNRTIEPPEGRRWVLEQGSQTYGRMWRVCSASLTTGAHYRDLAYGATERELQMALGHFLDGYDMACDAR